MTYIRSYNQVRYCTEEYYTKIYGWGIYCYFIKKSKARLEIKGSYLFEGLYLLSLLYIFAKLFTNKFMKANTWKCYAFICVEGIRSSHLRGVRALLSKIFWNSYLMMAIWASLSWNCEYYMYCTQVWHPMKNMFSYHRLCELTEPIANYICILTIGEKSIKHCNFPGNSHIVHNSSE